MKYKHTNTSIYARMLNNLDKVETVLLDQKNVKRDTVSFLINEIKSLGFNVEYFPSKGYKVTEK